MESDSTILDSLVLKLNPTKTRYGLPSWHASRIHAFHQGGAPMLVIPATA